MSNDVLELVNRWTAAEQANDPVELDARAGRGLRRRGPARILADATNGSPGSATAWSVTI